MNHCLILSTTEFPSTGRMIGAYRIASVLRENGWDAEVIDFANIWKYDELVHYLRAMITKDTKFIGISHLFANWGHQIERLTRWLKVAYPHIYIIEGGPGNPLQHTDNVDFYIQGFAETAIFVLLKYLFSNGDRPLFYPNKVMGRKFINAYHTYPAYPLKSLMIKYEDRDFIQPWEWLPIEISRGCKFKCSFCNFPVLGVKGDYSRDADDFREELQIAYDKYGVTNHHVSDETFNDTTEKITKFADAVEQLSFSPTFAGYIRADLLISRQKDREELARMNFIGQFYGIESFNYESAKAVGKGMKTERIQEGILEVRKYFKTHGSKNYRGTLSFIAGLPYETYESLEKTKKWLIDNWQGESFTAFPLDIPMNENDVKSELSIDYKKYGYESLGPLDLVEFGRKGNGDVQLAAESMNWKNENMDVHGAQRVANEMFHMRRSGQYDFRLNDILLGSWCHASADGSIEKILELKESDYAGESSLLAQKRLRLYMDKKLERA